MYTCEECRELLNRHDIWTNGGIYYCDFCDWELNDQAKAADIKG